MNVLFGDAVKALGNGVVGGYLIRFGGVDDTDLVDDFFTSRTDFEVDATKAAATAIRYHHGLDVTIGKKKIADGFMRIDDVGVWVEAQISMRDDYEKAIYALTEAGKLGWSSGTAPNLVERKATKSSDGRDVHEIVRWPLGLDASLTPIPCEYRNGAVVAMESVKAADFKELIGSLKSAMTDEERRKHAVIVHGNDRHTTAYVSTSGKLHLFPIPPGDKNAAKVAMNELHRWPLTHDERKTVHDAAVPLLGDDHASEWCPYCNDAAGYAKSATGEQEMNEQQTAEFNALKTTVDELATSVAAIAESIKSLTPKEQATASAGDAANDAFDPTALVDQIKSAVTETVKAEIANLRATPVQRTRQAAPAGAAQATKSVTGDPLDDEADSEHVKAIKSAIADLSAKAEEIKTKRQAGHKFSPVEQLEAERLVDQLNSKQVTLRRLELGLS
jgi:hypothetical protein